MAAKLNAIEKLVILFGQRKAPMEVKCLLVFWTKVGDTVHIQELRQHRLADGLGSQHLLCCAWHCRVGTEEVVHFHCQCTLRVLLREELSSLPAL